VVRVHGNWCGPNWTDGQAITAAEHKARGGTFREPCQDQLDCACRTHDKDCSGKQGCTGKADEKLIDQCNRILINPVNLILNPLMYGKARLVRDFISIARITRDDA
jgi:hypothetical protein|tara:strand:+ start:1355 stop:1672 length:318 start_codon:yes stop_codon:yes gene_type:complete